MNELSNLERDPLWPLLNQSTDGVALASLATGRLACVNSALARRLGHASEELRELPLDDFFCADSRDEIRKHLENAWYGGGASSRLSVHLRTGVLDDWLDMRVCRVVVGGERFLAMTFPVATKLLSGPGAESNERRDPLTGLHDRQFLLSRLATLLNGERVDDREFAVLFVDLDNFKQINDAYGHLVGDRVLCEVGRRLTNCVREADHVARFGGDEFVVIIEHVLDLVEIDPVINRIEIEFATPVVVPEGEFSLSVSVGWAVASPEHHSPEDLLRDADQAMYAAKRVRH